MNLLFNKFEISSIQLKNIVEVLRKVNANDDKPIPRSEHISSGNKKNEMVVRDSELSFNKNKNNQFIIGK